MQGIESREGGDSLRDDDTYRTLTGRVAGRAARRCPTGSGGLPLQLALPTVPAGSSANRAPLPGSTCPSRPRARKGPAGQSIGGIKAPVDGTTVPPAARVEVWR